MWPLLSLRHLDYRILCDIGLVVSCVNGFVCGWGGEDSGFVCGWGGEDSGIIRMALKPKKQFALYEAVRVRGTGPFLAEECAKHLMPNLSLDQNCEKHRAGW
jgi:hypothetical protein